MKKSIYGRFQYVCITIGEVLIPADEGIWDNYRVKRQILHSWFVDCL